MSARFTSLEVCAGAGGQALGLHAAGFRQVACVELDQHACQTLRINRPKWNVIQEDLREWMPAAALQRVTLLTGGVPCPPFSFAGNQLGRDDERDLFPEMVKLARVLKPEAIMIENVRGLLGRKFDAYRLELLNEFMDLGYEPCGTGPTGWQLLNASDFGLPQSRRRAILVLMKPEAARHFSWPREEIAVGTVGEMLEPLMAEGGWERASEWAAKAQGLGPAIVGGSQKHGGADLGPTSAKAAWRRLGIDGMGIADEPPRPGFKGLPRLTVRMAAALQGFPSCWRFSGGKTAAYRQVGNALPPPIAEAVGRSIAAALREEHAANGDARTCRSRRRREKLIH